MKKMIIILALIVSLSLPSMVFASRDYVGTRANAFTKVALGARQVGMGEAFTGLADDVYALNYNVAGLSFRRFSGSPYQFSEISCSYNEWIEDTHQGMLGYAKSWINSSLGLSVTGFYEGTVDARDVDGNLTGETPSTYDIIGNLGYSYKLGQNFAIGVGGEFTYVDLAQEEQTTSWCVNAGLMGNFELNAANFRIGASGKNIVGSKVKFMEREFDQEQLVAAGAALTIPFSPIIKGTLASDVVTHLYDDINGDNLLIRLGGEVLLFPGQEIAGAARFGRKFQYDIEDWYFGFGVMKKDFLQVDYSYTPIDVLEDSQSHRISLSYHFGGGEKEKDFTREEDDTPAEIIAATPPPVEEIPSSQRALERVMEIAEATPEMEAFALEDDAGVRLRLHINFDFDEAKIREADKSILERAYEAIEQFPESMIQLEGHTDYVGAEDYNIGLSYNRVNSVLNYFVSQKKIVKGRFYNPVGYGETKPIAPNTTAEGRFKNRRVEIIIYKAELAPPKVVGTTLQDIKIQTGSEGKAQVILVFNGNMMPDKEFILPNPSRLVIDIGNVKSAIDKKIYPAGIGNLKQIRVAPHEDGNFVRVVLDLLRNITEQDYKLETMGNQIIITVK